MAKDEKKKSPLEEHFERSGRSENEPVRLRDLLELEQAGFIVAPAKKK